jgi:hypothetical protein
LVERPRRTAEESALDADLQHRATRYRRAARIIDRLQTAGVLEPSDASKAREVLVGLEDLDRISR